MRHNSRKEDIPPKKGKKIKRKRKTRLSDRAVRGYALLLVCVLAVVGAALFLTFGSPENSEPVSEIWEETESTPETGNETAEKEDTEEEKEKAVLPDFPKEIEVDSEVVVPEEEKEHYVQVNSCMILPDGERFGLKGEVENLPESDDDRFYLIALRPYEEEIPEEAEAVAETTKERSFMLMADVNEFGTDSRLYDKFVVAVKENGQYVAMSSPYYITNPEALADYSEPFPASESIKGLLVDPLKLATSELDELGVKHAVYNIPIARLLGSSTHRDYPTITYTYNGKEYTLNGHVVDEYDYVFSTLTRKGIVITAILLNNKSSAAPQMIHPLSRSGNAYYYAFNAAEEEGCEYLEAISAFLAERYRDREHGTVMNWIVGNEINVRSLWNYMQNVELETYVREYARAFRLIYNGIRSMNANARVYISLDQQWTGNLTSNTSYNSRDILDEFNACIRKEGNIDWGLAHHPYSVPLTWPKFWELSDKNAALVLESKDTSMVTIYNIDVVTDYLQQPEFLTSEGQVRPIILSEMGFTSTYGEDVQAAAFAYAYYIAENNPYIDAMILSRETDAAEEVAQGLALGISYQNGRKKYIYDVFRYIDTEKSGEYTEFAKRYIGIEEWNEVIDGKD